MQAGHGIAKLQLLQNFNFANGVTHLSLAYEPVIQATVYATKDQTNNAPLAVSKLGCLRGERSLFSNLSFTVHEQQCLHIIGANGCGKTSLLRILSGINTPDQGCVQWYSKTIRQNSDFFHNSTYIGHKDGVKGELTTAENLHFYQTVEGIVDDDIVDACLAKMGLLECADLAANKLSFGQRRRLAFARLLQPDFKLWVLDEPFTGMDLQGRELLEKLCAEHLQNGGLIVLSNHQSLMHSQLAANLVELKL